MRKTGSISGNVIPKQLLLSVYESGNQHLSQDLTLIEEQVNSLSLQNISLKEKLKNENNKRKQLIRDHKETREKVDLLLAENAKLKKELSKEIKARRMLSRLVVGAPSPNIRVFTEEDLITLFSQAGTVKSARVISVSQNRFSIYEGLVEMSSLRDAIDAINMLNGKAFNGHGISVSLDRSSREW